MKDEYDHDYNYYRVKLIKIKYKWMEGMSWRKQDKTEQDNLNPNCYNSVKMFDIITLQLIAAYWA